MRKEHTRTADLVRISRAGVRAQSQRARAAIERMMQC